MGVEIVRTASRLAPEPSFDFGQKLADSISLSSTAAPNGATIPRDNITKTLGGPTLITTSHDLYTPKCEVPGCEREI